MHSAPVRTQGRWILVGSLFLLMVLPGTLQSELIPTYPEDLSAQSMPPFGVPLPERGAYLGAYCPTRETSQVTEKSIYDFETLSGKRPLFVHLYVDWLEDNPVGQSVFLEFPRVQCNIIRRLGFIPVITWQTNIEAKHTENGYLLDRIAKGEFDEHLRAWARAIHNYRGPLFLRWGHEMNGDWFPWAGVNNGGDTPLPGGVSQQPSGPERYRKAWLHIRTVFQIEQVKNVRWIWSVYHSNSVRRGWNDMRSYWPGPHEVDWIGISAVNWSPANRSDWKEWRGFEDIIDDCYQRVTLQLPAKPLFLMELACANPAARDDGDKARWIKKALKAIPKKYSQIKALCWYNSDVAAQPGLHPANFRLDFAPYRKSYAKGIEGSYYLDALPRPRVEKVRRPKPQPKPQVEAAKGEKPQTPPGENPPRKVWFP